MNNELNIPILFNLYFRVNNRLQDFNQFLKFRFIWKRNKPNEVQSFQFFIKTT